MRLDQETKNSLWAILEYLADESKHYEEYKSECEESGEEPTEHIYLNCLKVEKWLRGIQKNG